MRIAAHSWKISPLTGGRKCAFDCAALCLRVISPPFSRRGPRRRRYNIFVYWNEGSDFDEIYGKAAERQTRNNELDDAPCRGAAGGGGACEARLRRVEPRGGDGGACLGRRIRREHGASLLHELALSLVLRRPRARGGLHAAARPHGDFSAYRGDLHARLRSAAWPARGVCDARARLGRRRGGAFL